VIRNPHAIRPWQHVLEPLAGYLLLAQRLYEDGGQYACGWNFGPGDEDAKQVEWIVRRLCGQWHDGATYRIDEGDHPHEAHYLKLDSTRAREELGWRPRWSLDTALQKILEWTAVYETAGNVRECCLQQIADYGEMR
jgi:CDP-glucose 4,6-dehydratase